MRLFSRRLIGSLALGSLAVGVLISAALLVGASVPAHAQQFTLGLNWQPLTLDQALAEAEKTGKKVLVEVWADHCEQCKVMDAEIWNTPDGITLANNAIPIKINSVAPEGQALAKRYPVLGLPLTIFLNEDGTEFDRVVGYDGQRPFLLEASPISQGIDGLPILEKRLAATPDDAMLMTEIFEKLLSRKRDADAKAMLDRIFAADAKTGGMVGERALGQMARYATYYQGDHAGAFELWKAIVDRYPTSSSMGGSIDGAYKAAVTMGKVGDWKTWLCAATQKHGKSGMLQQAAALTAYRYKVMDPCFGQAARTAIALGMKAPNLEAVAVAMEGK